MAGIHSRRLVPKHDSRHGSGQRLRWMAEAQVSCARTAADNVSDAGLPPRARRGTAVGQTAPDAVSGRRDQRT